MDHVELTAELTPLRTWQTGLGALAIEPKLPLPRDRDRDWVAQWLQKLLADPSRELLQRPSHQFRAQLVRIGFHLGGGQDTEWNAVQGGLCADAMEYLHMGSLIVDDIQDGSEFRRNGPALHCTLGTPHALAVGNWLYFHALSLLDRLELPATAQLGLVRAFHRLVELAHYGQALDVCVKVDANLEPAELVALSEACLHYKTGAIVALALVMGACLAQANPERINAIEHLGLALGAYLQRYNDVGNLLGAFDPDKKWEDLLGRKPSYVWVLLVETYGPEGLRSFQQAFAKLPDERALQTWMQERGFAQAAKQRIEAAFDQALTDFTETTKMPLRDLKTLLTLKERIQKAYV